MSYRGWSNLVLGFIIIPVLIIALLNYIIDPFSIFHSNVLKHPFEMNERFNKIRHIERCHNQYDSYIFGSSRIGTTSPDIIEKYIPESHFYNLTAAGSTQYDNEMVLKYLIKRHYPIKNIYLQIDLTDIYGYESPPLNYNAKHHPHVTETPLIQFYLSYLSILPVNNFINKIKVNYFGYHKNYLRHDIEKTGRWYADHLEALIKENHERYIQNESSFSSQFSKKINKGTKIINNINSLKNIKKLCDAHQINLIVFITPHNQHLMSTLDRSSYLQYLEEISKIVAFWDFSGPNFVTLDDHFYYENSHYRGEVAEYIAARIFNYSELSNPMKKFGTYVTNTNSHMYLAKKREDILQGSI